MNVFLLDLVSKHSNIQNICYSKFYPVEFNFGFINIVCVPSATIIYFQTSKFTFLTIRSLVTHNLII